MREMLELGTAAISVTFGGVVVNAPNPNAPSWSLYAITGYDAAPLAMKSAPTTEGRSAHTIANPEGPLNDYYKGVGLSDDQEDCNRECADCDGG